MTAEELYQLIRNVQPPEIRAQMAPTLPPEGTVEFNGEPVD